ncbi:MAG: hypothetical protein GXX10_03290 [Clostridiaceae bacterium]|nr:hypothetical protein [Clostridiaceae bacterium]
MALKFARILHFLLILACMLVLTAVRSEARSLQDASGIERHIIDEKLRTDEIKSIKDAFDKAIRKEKIYNAYEFNSDEILENTLKGKPMDNLKGIPRLFMSLFGKEIKANIGLALQIMAIMLLGALIRALQPLSEGMAYEAAKLGINGIIVLTASVAFGSVVKIATYAIDTMQNIASVAIPAIYALMAASGQIVSVAAIQPLMLVGVNIACQILKDFLLPMAVTAGVLFLIDSISERFSLKKLAKLFKSCSVWMTGVITLVFSVAVSIQKLASASVDAVTLKTAKFAIGTFIPVAGKYMSDAADTILLCASAVRNAAGILTVIALGLIFLAPLVKVFAVMLVIRIAAAFGSPVCDENITDALEDASGCISVIIGIMGASMFVLILLTGTLMNSGGLLT